MKQISDEGWIFSLYRVKAKQIKSHNKATFQTIKLQNYKGKVGWFRNPFFGKVNIHKRKCIPFWTPFPLCEVQQDLKKLKQEYPKIKRDVYWLLDNPI